MAEYLASKVPTEVVRRAWTVPVDADDAPASVVLSASGVTVDSSEFVGNDLEMTLSGGTAAATASIVATVTTDKSRVLVETLYLPIIASASQVAATARDYAGFALRKIVGLGEDPGADELAHALDCLTGIVGRWREGGADIGAAYPITANTVIYCPDWAVTALRYNLLIECASIFGLDPTPYEYDQARRGLQLIKHKNLPNRREVEFY